MRRAALVLALVGAALAGAAPAMASGWLPHPAGASWTYRWSDTGYAPTGTNEKVWVASTSAKNFTLAWSSADASLGNAAGAVAGSGTMRFQDTRTGVINTDWSSTGPPASLPDLCPAGASADCGNSLGSAYYNFIWGSSAPTIAEPLVFGLTWSSHGGAGNTVRSTSKVVGIQDVTVPAFAKPISALRIESRITQPGNAYGSGTRTVWWVWGIGPIYAEFNHADSRKSVTKVVLTRTSLSPEVAPVLGDFFPLGGGLTGIYSWTNAKHLAKPVVERIASTSAGQFTASTVSGPVQVQGSYRYDFSVDGVVNVSATTKSASLATLPGLGPKKLPPGKRRRFVTPFDLMNFGIDPVVPAYPEIGQRWKTSTTGHDFQTYGVTGSSRVAGFQYVDVPAGRFLTLVVQSTLTQPGFPFGSGTRTSYFAPGYGLVKLVFHHKDGSVSVVTRLV